MKRTIYKLATAIMAASALCSCHDIYDPDPYDVREGNNDFTIWKFVHDCSETMYLWNQQVPERVTYSKYASPAQLFDSWRHPDDRFSRVYSNYSSLSKQLNNQYVTSGMEMRMSLYENNVVGIVEYVYQDSPAGKAGIRRGQVLTKVNGTALTRENYQELMAIGSATYTFGSLETDISGHWSVNTRNAEQHQITQIEMDIPPVQIAKTFNTNGNKTAYILYNSFTRSAQALRDSISRLMDESISNLILDLRMNGGGYANTMDTVASMLLPGIMEGEVFLKTRYNSFMSQQYLDMYGEDFDKRKFVKTDVRLGNLQNIYVITSQRTASASEQLISGLRPYINVTTIGARTYGKFTSCLLINDNIDRGYDPLGIPYKEWCLYLCVGASEDSRGQMDFAQGIMPDFPMDDTYMEPLGSISEPLLAKALELASGGAIAKSGQKASALMLQYIDTQGKPDICKGAMILEEPASGSFR